MSEDVHARLAKHLDTLPIAYPATESGIEIRILKRWFTDEEAAIALAMRGWPEPMEKIAERSGIPAGELSSKLDTMASKGNIFRIAKGDRRFYNLVPLAEGFWEFHVNENDLEAVRDLHEYFHEYMEKSWYGTSSSQHRVIPVSQSVSDRTDIMSYDQAEEIIRDQTKIAVAPCICRKEHAQMGKGCDRPLEVCMAFGTGAHFYVEQGLGRDVSTEEALDILRRGMDAGLVLQPGNGRKVWSMCLCCGCCCGLLLALKRTERPAHVVHTSFYAVIDDDACTLCGVCEERCPMDAVAVDDAASIDRDRCIGCGVCVPECPTDAIALVQKAEGERHVPPKDITELHMTIAKERGLM